MSEQPRFASSKRARLYTRKFDYEEARDRKRAGESIAALAREYGVSEDGVRRGIERAARDAERGIRRLAPGETPEASIPLVHRCPICQGRKTWKATLCFTCRKDTGLAPMSLERVPARRRVRLANVKLGRVVKCRGRWGVVESLAGPKKRAIHYWDGPIEAVSTITIVDVAPSFRVLVDSIEQEPELAA